MCGPSRSHLQADSYVCRPSGSHLRLIATCVDPLGVRETVICVDPLGVIFRLMAACVEP
jgi:hypothetical protein